MEALRVYTAPGESRDLLELLTTAVDVREVASLTEVRDPGTPAVLVLSRGLLHGLSADEWAGLPVHIVVVTADAEAEEAAVRAGRLFESVATLRCGGSVLQATLEKAAEVSARRLRVPPATP